ncbi:MAG: CRISPR-associated endonuclease Cas2 [Patescibacteria group bacterium]|nr:CRISPR-associated endonuclease Cas2 [Patescibacteria group bacterium]
MYCLVVYDVNTDRVAKVLKFMRRHMHWIQNSVFEGVVTKAQLREIKAGLNNIIKQNEDSIYFFITRDKKYMEKEILGKEVSSTDNFI